MKELLALEILSEIFDPKSKEFGYDQSLSYFFG